MCPLCPGPTRAGLPLFPSLALAAPRAGPIALCAAACIPGAPCSRSQHLHYQMRSRGIVLRDTPSASVLAASTSACGIWGLAATMVPSQICLNNRRVRDVAKELQCSPPAGAANAGLAIAVPGCAAAVASWLPPKHASSPPAGVDEDGTGTGTGMGAGSTPRLGCSWASSSPEPGLPLTGASRLLSCSAEPLQDSWRQLQSTCRTVTAAGGVGTRGAHASRRHAVPSATA